MLDNLYIDLSDGDLSLIRLGEVHREGLRAACAADPDLWVSYLINYGDDGFDPAFDRMLHAGPSRQGYAIYQGGVIVGMTAWIDADADRQSVEIGNSYIIPALRGTGFNRRLKTLMMDHAFAQGIRRLVYKVDALNARSQAAVLKLGCTREGVLRAERVTWTGRLRDTVIFSILADEWAAERG